VEEFVEAGEYLPDRTDAVHAAVIPSKMGETGGGAAA
jgi:hypothetical protein